MKIHFIQHVEFEYPGYLLQWAKENNHQTGFTKLYENISFPSVENFDMLIIMGGPMSVYEEEKYDWLEDEKEFIKMAIAANKKVLGICLGSQLIAEVLGAKVYPHTLKEIGWWPIQKAAKHELTEHLPQEFITFHWHGDTFDLPKNATQLFKSEACAQQGFVYSRNVAALQFHMEVMNDLLHNMTENEKHELIADKYIQTEQIIHEGIKEFVPLQNNFMKEFMNAFIAL